MTVLGASSVTPPSPQRVAALQFLGSVAEKMFSAGGTWVDDTHALAFRNSDINVSLDDLLEKLCSGDPAYEAPAKIAAAVFGIPERARERPGTPEYVLARKLSEVLGIQCKYIHSEGYVIEGKESLDVLANAGIGAIAQRGYGEKQRAHD